MPIDSKLCVLHKNTCNNKNCFNPKHLYLGNQSDNLQDATKLGKTGQHNRNKTHCPKGHEYTKENTYKNGNGRKCKTCVLERYHLKSSA